MFKNKKHKPSLTANFAELSLPDSREEWSIFGLPSIFARSYTGISHNQKALVEPDYFRGYRFARGLDFVGQHSFVSLETIIEVAQSSGYPLVINLGDSSTSGWDSRSITRNRQLLLAGNQNLELPLFKYLTYSDLLSDLAFSSGLPILVVNVGIPGYTSIQGVRYAAELITLFQAVGIRIAAVNAYFGNNDCIWNANFEDSKVLPGSSDSLVDALKQFAFETGRSGKLLLTKHQLRRAAPRSDIIITRVSCQEYISAIRTLVALVYAAEALPIIIVPQVPLHWQPGYRLVDEPTDRPWMANLPGGPLVLEELSSARSEWRALNANGGEPLREGILLQKLAEVAERDFLVPRIKLAYARALRELCTELQAPCIVATSQQPEHELFLDYCHPVGALNTAIALSLADYIREHLRVSNSLKPKFFSKLP